MKRLFTALALLIANASAHAELMLNPTRVVFAGNQRAAQIELINNGTAPASYRISLVNRRMTETGEFQPVDAAAPGEQFADGMLSFSPRQVTLQPGTAQVVRVMVRKSAELPAGEYRSHLHFEKLADAEGAASVEASNGEPRQIGVVVKTLVGASLPLIVRHQTTGASVALAGLALQAAGPDRPPVLAFRIERSGDSSVYGDISVSYQAAGGAEKTLAQANGVAVYTPNGLRRAALTLQTGPGIDFARGSLRLRFRERTEAGGALLAEARLDLP